MVVEVRYTRKTAPSQTPRLGFLILGISLGFHASHHESKGQTKEPGYSTFVNKNCMILCEAISET